MQSKKDLLSEKYVKKKINVNKKEKGKTLLKI